MGSKDQLIIVDAYEAFDVIYGEVSRIPVLFRTTDGRIFYLWPYGLLDELANWYLRGIMDVMIIDHKTKKMDWKGGFKENIALPRGPAVHGATVGSESGPV